MLQSIIEEVLSLDEKTMTGVDKAKAAKNRKKGPAKKAKKLIAKCMAMYGDKVKNSNGKLICKSNGKVGKGLSKAKKKLMAKSRRSVGVSGKK